ncbi:MAG: hypothetical protein ACXQTP_01270 [Candidatus Methanofastidiosia archaeon]
MTGRKVLLIFFSVFCVFFLVASVFAIDAKENLFDPEFYVESFDDAGVYEKIAEFLAQDLAKGLDEEIADLNEEEIRDIIEEVVNPQWTKDSMETIIRSILDYINGDTDEISGFLDLTPIKTGFINVIERDHPDLSTEEITNEMPDAIYLTELLEKDDLVMAREGVSNFNRGTEILIIITAILILLILFLGYDLSEKTKYLGMVFAISGIVISALTYAQDRIFSQLLSNTEEVVFNDVILALRDKFLAKLLYHGLIIFAIGIALYIVSRILKSREKESLPIE